MAQVSILMNGYNSEKYLKETIDSVYAQTFENWEIIFIDNCSTDGTKKIVDSYDEKIKYYKTDKNIPLGAARNFGLKYCKSEYIAFLDTDDIWIEDKLSIQISIMNKNLEFQFSYGGVIYIDESGKETGRMMPRAKNESIFPQLLKSYEINQQTMVIRNNIDMSFNEQLQYSPDFDLFMMIASKYKGCVINNYIVKYRIHSSSLSSKYINIWWSDMKYTLDEIFCNNNTLKEQYFKEYKRAYAKVAYLKAVYLMSLGKKKDANLELSKYKFVNYKYFIVYIVSWFPSPIWNFFHRKYMA